MISPILEVYTYKDIGSNIEIHDKNILSNEIIALKPEAIIISDTYNHFLFPIKEPRIDSVKSNLRKVYNQLRVNYTSYAFDFFPWHYMTELTEIGYVVYNTRPINLRFPISSGEAKQYSESEIFDKYEIQNCIHVTIIGDSNSDIYTKDLYKMIREICIIPIYRLTKPRKSLKDFVVCLTGSKFNTSAVTLK